MFDPFNHVCILSDGIIIGYVDNLLKAVDLCRRHTNLKWDIKDEIILDIDKFDENNFIKRMSSKRNNKYYSL